jgi:uncharacterized protein (TIGR02466 family)
MIHDVFPVRIYKTQSNLKQQEINAMRTYLREQFSHVDNGNHKLEEGGKSLFNINSNLHLEEVFQPLVRDIISHIEEFWDIMLFTEETDPKITDMWANIHQHGNKTLLHSHTNIITVGCYYLDFPKNAGNLIFKDPNEYTQHYYPYDTDGKQQYQWHEVELSENDIVLFPGHLQHQTASSMSNKDRISINFNVNMTERQPEVLFDLSRTI